MKARLKNFWTWFQARAGKIKDDPRSHADEISEMLDRLHRGLAWEMGSPDGRTWDFIIRTEAADLRFLTHEIVAGAPPMPGWNFLSWRPPAPSTDWKIAVGEGEAFSLGDCTAEIAPDAEFPFLHLVLACPAFQGKPTDRDRYGGYLALDALLGEKLVEDALDSIEFRTGPPGPVAADAMRKEVARGLEEARSRPLKMPSTWMLLRAEREGRPAFVNLSENPGWDRVGSLPWLVEVRVAVKESNEQGLPGRDELARLQALEDRLEPEVKARTPGVLWGAVTHDGRRTSGFYVAEPSGLRESLAAVVAGEGFEAEVVVEYDARWRTYRQYRPPAES